MPRPAFRVGTLVLLIAPHALAQTFVGSTAHLEAYYPNLQSPQGLNLQAPVADPDPGQIEFPQVFGRTWSADVDATTIVLNHHAQGNLLGPAAFNGFVFTFTGLASPIASATLDSGSTLIPFALTSSEDAIFLNYQGLGVIGPGSTIVNVTFDQGCYPDCDTSTGPGVLDIFDFLCFQNRYDAGAPYACDCDTTTGPANCDIFDFLCFQNAFDAGCP